MPNWARSCSTKLKRPGIDTTLERATAAAVLLKERATFVEDMLGRELPVHRVRR
jgi:predicted nuclease with RNAse H fold